MKHPIATIILALIINNHIESSSGMSSGRPFNFEDPDQHLADQGRSTDDRNATSDLRMPRRVRIINRQQRSLQQQLMEQEHINQQELLDQQLIEQRHIQLQRRQQEQQRMGRQEAHQRSIAQRFSPHAQLIRHQDIAKDLDELERKIREKLAREDRDSH